MGMSGGKRAPRSSLIPVHKERRVTKRLVLFHGEEDGLPAAYAVRLKRSGGRLVPCEGAELFGSFSAEALYRAPVSGDIYAYADGKLFRYEGAFYALGELKKPCAVLEWFDKNDVLHVYAVDEERVYELLESSISVIKNACGGTCAAIHYERLFTAKGHRVYYSDALDVSGWEHSYDGAGYFDLPSDKGDIIAFQPYKEKLYLFRERGIDRLRALGDNLNFQAVELPFFCGEIRKNSVSPCGEELAFFTENGLYLFNGDVCRRAEGSGDFLVGEGEIAAASADGKYYAAVPLRRGGRDILVYSYDEKSGYLLGHGAEKLIGGEGILFSEEGKLFRITGEPYFFDERREGCYESEWSDFDLPAARKRAVAVYAEGQGSVRLLVRSNEGDFAEAVGRAGAMLALSKTVCGETFSLRIYVYGERANVRSVSLRLWEEDDIWTSTSSI